MADLVGTILEVVKYIGRPARKYLNYHRKFKAYLDAFKQAQEDLQARKRDVQQQLEDEHGFGKKPKQEVERWIQKAEEKLRHANHVDQDKISKVKYLFHSCLGKLVDEVTQEMKELYAEGDFSASLVVGNSSTTKVKLLTEELEGPEKAAEIYQYLIGDEIRKIGVCGMGGIGKTTIMKHVHNMLLEETKFSKVIWTTVSQDFDIRRLQKKIASQLRANQLSDYEDTIIRAAKLSEMLRTQGSYVVILDDVWSSFSLEDVGIPEPTTDHGCKLVLTTRSEEVVRSMGCTKVQVACLSIDAAFQLFLRKVGQEMLHNPKIESTMKHIVEECDGLPLAIVTVAGTMKGISDALRWEIALKQLRGQTRNMKDVEDKVFGCLMFSYEHLEQIEQHCFLWCALFPEDFKLKKVKIIECWIDDGLMDEMGTREEKEDFGYVVLKKLEENCLLERVEKGNGLKMHDVVRDMALHITKRFSPRYFVKAGMQLTEVPDEQHWTEDLEKVSLMRNSIAKIPPNTLSLKCEKLTTLLLSRNSLKEIPDSFFDHMPKLKILDLSQNPIVSLPNSLFNLENLAALLLSYCKKLQIVSSISKLKALKKLDLRYTSIKEIPHGLEELVNLKYLDLGFTKCLKEIPGGLLSKLCRLQYMEIHPASTGAEDMRELNKLEVFQGCFNVLDWTNYVGQRKMLHKYKIMVIKMSKGLHFNYFKEIDYSKEVIFEVINMNSGDKIIVPYDIQKLKVKRCRGMRRLQVIGGWEDVTDLKECTIDDCGEMESIFSSECRQLETLESLTLCRLENLKDIVGESSVATFSSLKKIYLGSCGKIKKLFSAKCVLHNLELVCVQECYKMEEIIESEEEGMGTIKYSLPKLTRLELSELPELKSICGKNGVMVSDSLQHMAIQGCPQLKRIPLFLDIDIDIDKGNPSPPPSLKQIRVNREKWQELEWDHPHAKNVLQPFLQFHE